MKTNSKYLGIEIGGTKLQLLVTDTSGNILQSLRYAINAEGGGEGIRKQVVDGWKNIDTPGDIAAIGVGFGGPVDWKTGTIKTSHQVRGWADFNLSKWLSETTNKPVVVENDANTAALAEALHGSGKGHERVFYVTVGSGIGGGIIINGDIYHGREPGEAEVGHLRLTKEGETLESKCSGWAVNKKVRAVIEREPDGLLAQLSAGSRAPEATLLQPALEIEDAAAKKIIEEVADDLSFALSHVVHIFHPDVLIIGGGLSFLKDHLRLPLNKKLPQYLMQAFLPSPPVRIASLGEQVVPIGAIELAKRINQFVKS